jgi:hypothetical protein
MKLATSTVNVRRMLCGYEICWCYGVYEVGEVGAKEMQPRKKCVYRNMGIDYTSLAARRRTWEDGRSVSGEFEGEWNDDDVICELDTPSCMRIWNE